MKLSAPLYRLKRKAKLLARDEKIPLHQALDRIAVHEGFSGWSLLAAKASAVAPASKVFARLQPGDLVLVGARPGHGKTLMSLELAVKAMKAGHRGVLYPGVHGKRCAGSFPRHRNGPGAFRRTV